MKARRNSPVVVFGAGSIGERYVRILTAMGFRNLHVFRQRNLPFRTIPPDQVRPFYNIGELDQIKPYFGIICTPTAMHLEQALLCAQKGIHVLVEKPLSNNTHHFAVLKQHVSRNATLVRTAYMLRFHPFFIRLKDVVQKNTFGKLLSAQSYWGEFLPNWHPWEDYRISYAARRELGGGAGLTLSHDLDLLLYLFPKPPESSSVQFNFDSDLGIEVDTASDITLRFTDGCTAHSHVNFHERISHRHYRFVFQRASVNIDYLQNQMNVFHLDGQVTVEKLPDFTRDGLYQTQLNQFIDDLSLGPSERILASISSINESETLLNILYPKTNMP